MKPWYGGINNHDDLKDCTPESFKFHGTFKSVARMIIPLLRTPQEWLDGITGNLAIVRSIYYEYLEHEKQRSRAEDPPKAHLHRHAIFSRVVPFALVIAYYDPNYREVVEWFLFRIKQEDMVFFPHHREPECWYQDGRGRAPASREAVDAYLKELH
jgi:hypothetical protein